MKSDFQRHDPLLLGHWMLVISTINLDIENSNAN